MPKALEGLDYDQYRDIRFVPTATVWTEGGRRFRLQWLHRGFLFADPVEMAIVSKGSARHVTYNPGMFTTGKAVSRPLPDEDIGFSGFRVLFPLNRPDRFDELAVFQGAKSFQCFSIPCNIYQLRLRGSLRFWSPGTKTENSWWNRHP